MPEKQPTAEQRVLSEKIEGLYTAFAARAPDQWHGQEVGIALDDFPALSTRPLRKLTRSQIWSFDDLSRKPPIHEMRYLLPRWIELLGQGQLVKNIEVACELTQLKASGFPEDWPDRDADLIEECLLALLSAVCSAPAHFHNDSLSGTEFAYTEMLLTAGVPVKAVLSFLDALPKEVRDRVIGNHLIHSTDALVFYFVEGKPATMLADWLVSKDLKGILENHFRKTQSEEDQWELSERLYYLERELAWRLS